MGVSGYLPKDRAGAELVIALRRLSEGKRYVTASMADQLVDSLGGRGGPVDPHEPSRPRSIVAVCPIAAGKTPAEIAETMHLSVKTVGSYRARILEKTGWKNNIELTKYCVQHRLSPDEVRDAPPRASTGRLNALYGANPPPAHSVSAAQRKPSSPG